MADDDDEEDSKRKATLAKLYPSMQGEGSDALMPGKYPYGLRPGDKVKKSKKPPPVGTT